MKCSSVFLLYLLVVTTLVIYRINCSARIVEAYFKAYRNDVEISDGVTLHKSVVHGRLECAPVCVSDDTCMMFSLCEVGGGKLSRRNIFFYMQHK